jgi:hypothetical protein
VLTGTLTATAVFGASNLKAVYVRKKTATGWEYEACDYTKLGAAIAAGYEIVKQRTSSGRSIDISGGANPSGSKYLYCKVATDCTVKWKQSLKIFTRVPAAARTALGQAETGTEAESVIGANYFVFATAWNNYPAGTLIHRDALKATVRYAAPTETDGGTYTSYAKENLDTPNP